MGYAVHIERTDGSAISLKEWSSAIAKIEGVRMASGDNFAANPKTGEKIIIPLRIGDVEVYFPENDAWIPCISWSEGRISFKASSDFLNSDSSFRKIIAALATELTAQLVGDCGEWY